MTGPGWGRSFLVQYQTMPLQPWITVQATTVCAPHPGFQRLLHRGDDAAMSNLFPVNVMILTSRLCVYFGVFCSFLQKEWREDPNGEFKKKVARCVRKSQEMAFD